MIDLRQRQCGDSTRRERDVVKTRRNREGSSDGHFFACPLYLCAFAFSCFGRASSVPALIVGTLLVFAPPIAADAPRVLPAGTLPADSRLEPLKDLNGYFPFTPPTDKEAWAKRADYVRRQILVSQGLWPMPTKTPLNAVIHGRIDCGEYTVEKVYFESVPGLFVTGNL